jgi:type I restriction enzyme M protein
MILTNPPFGRKSSVTFVNEDGGVEKERQVIVRQDFWASTSNKQLNFVQHVYTMLKVNGRAAVVVPDNVLFEGGAGEKVRRQLLKTCDIHTLVRLPTGIWYSTGVKANLIFFDKKPGREKPWTTKLWVYDLRTNMHFTLKQKPIRRDDFDEFVRLYKPGERTKRRATWTEKKPEGRWRSYTYDELLKRDKVSLDLFWLRDESLEDGENLPAPEVLAAEIADDLQAAMEQFAGIAEELREAGKRREEGTNGL